MKKSKPVTHQRPVTFYVSDEEYKIIAAHGAAYGSVSGWVRAMLELEEVKRGAPYGNDYRDHLASLRREQQTLQALYDFSQEERLRKEFQE